MAEIREVSGYAVEQGMEIDRSRRLALHVRPDERQGVLRHALHLVRRADDLPSGVPVLDELGMEPEAGEWSPQIVRYLRQLDRAVAHVSIEPSAHEIEGPHGAADLERAGLQQLVDHLTPTETASGRGKVIGRYKVTKHITWSIDDDGVVSFRRDDASIAAEARLDGLYVIRTGLPESELVGPGTVRAYKRLNSVERVFRSLKTVDLKVRRLPLQRAPGRAPRPVVHARLLRRMAHAPEAQALVAR